MGVSARDSTTNGDDLVWDMMVIPANERMAANAIALCQRDHGTFHRRAMDKKCSDRRNAREIDVLSLVFDALIANRNDVAMELIARRIVGIEEADRSGHWNIADAIQVMRTGSLMSEQQVLMNSMIMNVRFIEIGGFQTRFELMNHIMDMMLILHHLSPSFPMTLLNH